MPPSTARKLADARSTSTKRVPKLIVPAEGAEDEAASAGDAEAAGVEADAVAVGDVIAAVTADAGAADSHH